MNTIKRIFQGSLLPSELMVVRKIVAIITLPVMVFYMTSLNFLVAGIMTAKAQEAVVENIVTPEEEVPAVEKKTEVAPEVEEPTAPVIPAEEVKTEIPKIEESAVVNEEAKAEEALKVEVAPVFSAPADVFPSVVDEAPAQDSFNVTTDALPTTPTVEATGPASAEKLVPQWNTDSKKATTSEAVQLNKTYVAPQNDQVTVTFTKLPASPGKLSIEEITLTAEQVSSLHALSNKAYDITSDMADGTFEYTLTLPKPKDQQNVQVKFAEDTAGLANADTVASGDVKTETNSVSAELDHFTIFVVVNPLPVDGPACIAAGADTGTGCYLTVQEAIDAAAASGDTINLNSDIVLASALNINKSVTIDGGSHTLSGDTITTSGAVTLKNLTLTGTEQYFAGDGNYGIWVASGTLTADNINLTVVTNGAGNADNDGFNVASGASLDLKNSTITLTGTTNNQHGVYAQSGAVAVTLTDNTFVFPVRSSSPYSYFVSMQGATVANYPTLTLAGTNTQNAYMKLLLVGADTLANKQAYALAKTVAGDKIGVMGTDQGIYYRVTDGWTITETVVAGVTPPVTGATPVTTITAGTQYTGTVAWSPNNSTFGPNRTYTATITLTATSGYSLVGVTANQFTVAGSTSATNSADSGVITAIFPVTEAKQLTITDPSLNLSKPYDGDTSAGTVTVGSLSGVFSPDDVTVSAVANYDNKNIGTGKIITIVYTLGGADAAKYIKPVNYEVATGIITARPITVTSATNTKIYDGLLTAAGVPTITTGTLATGDVSTFSETYDNKNVGTTHVLTPAGTIADGSAVNMTANYDITFTTIATGIITTRPITVTSATNTKIYDGLLTAAGVPTITTGTLATGDVSTFSETYDNKNVGTTHVLTPAGTIADGSAVNMTANYDITFTTIATGIITQATSTTEVTCPADSQTYTGLAITPCTVSVTGAGGLSLTPDPTYTNNVNVGIATASYTYAGDTNHTGSSDSTTFSIGQVEPDEDGNVILDNGNPQAVLTDEEQAVTIEVEAGTENPTIDVSALLTGGTATLPEITIYTEVAEVFIPAGTTVTGPAGWDGVISAPTAGTPSGGNAPAGFAVGDTVITLGSTLGTITFDTPVVITLPGVTGTVGYRPAGSSQWTEITNVCTGTYENPTGAVYPGECAISNGIDTKIVTFHFTSFGELLDTKAPKSVDNFKGVYSPITGDVKLTWDVNNKDTAKVSIYRGTTKHYDLNSHSRLNTQDRRDEDYTDADVTPGKTYYYKLVAKDEAGNKSDIRVIKITIPTDGGVAASTPETTEKASTENTTQEEVVATPDEAGVSAKDNSNQSDSGKGSVLGETTDQGNGNQQSGFWASNWKWFLALVLTGGAIFFWRKRQQGDGKSSY